HFETADIGGLVALVADEISVFEEDYLELKEEEQVHRYNQFRQVILRTQSREGIYSTVGREQIINYFQHAEIDMSKENVTVSHVVGPVNVGSWLSHVTQSVQQATGLPVGRKEELTGLISELETELRALSAVRPGDAERVRKSAEM